MEIVDTEPRIANVLDDEGQHDIHKGMAPCDAQQGIHQAETWEEEAKDLPDCEELRRTRNLNTR